jgi:hypothetical protein
MTSAGQPSEKQVQQWCLKTFYNSMIQGHFVILWSKVIVSTVWSSVIVATVMKDQTDRWHGRDHKVFFACAKA